MEAARGGLRGPARPRTARDVNRRILSQNFLRGPAAVGDYLASVDLDAGDLVLEVGAGDGAITEALAPRCREVRAYEIDRHLLPALRYRVGQLGNVRVMAGDFLTARPPAEPFVVVGNVPFSITSPVVDWCLRAAPLTSATIITQLEYARKRTGGYGRWGLLTVSTWPWFDWSLRGSIARTRFRPMPSVDAGILRLARRPSPLVGKGSGAEYRRMVELGFGGVGGTLYRSLTRRYPRPATERAFQAAGVRHDVVVAYVTPDQWLRIFAVLAGEHRELGRRK